MGDDVLISFIVVRHGESDANAQGIISDKDVDHQLTELGVEQAKETAARLKDDHFDCIVSSTRQRARLTAEIINEHHDVDIVSYDALIERDFGVFSGKPKEEARQQMLEEGFFWVDIPQSETLEQIDRRVRAVLREWVQNYPYQRILVATHEDIVRSFHRVLNDMSFDDSVALEIHNSDPHCFDLMRDKFEFVES